MEYNKEVDKKEDKGQNEIPVEQKTKRGRKPKNAERTQYEPKDQNKFFIDVSKNKEQRALIQSVLNQANNKSYGREIILKDLVLIALPKITSKEIERLQETSLSEMERVTMALGEYNKKAETKLTLGEFLVKKLSL